MLLFAAVSAQTVTLRFTGRDASNQYVPLNRVVVSNLTRGWQDTLFWPDTVLVMTDQTGIEDVETFPETSLRLSQNNPNPFDGTTYVNLNVTETGEVSLVMTDITGRIVSANHYSPLQPGIHEIRITLSSAGIFFLTARQNGQSSSVKMVNGGNGSGDAIAFTGTVGANHYSSLLQPKNATKGFTNNTFVAGDQMQYVGFITLNGAEEESGQMIQTQDSTQTIVLSFEIIGIDSFSCVGTPFMIDFDGNVYNTVQIGTQCWMRENMRTTKTYNGTSIPHFTSSFTDFCYTEDTTSVIPLWKRGCLYSWTAAKQSCPAGWHLPSDAEWTNLTNYVSSQSAYICGGNTSYIAKALCSTDWWESYNDACSPGYQSLYTNNASGFEAIPAGLCDGLGFFASGHQAWFWTSSDTGSNAWYRRLVYHIKDVGRDYCGQGGVLSVRCLRD